MTLIRTIKYFFTQDDGFSSQFFNKPKNERDVLLELRTRYNTLILLLSNNGKGKIGSVVQLVPLYSWNNNCTRI